jgi:hypothetical protein
MDQEDDRQTEGIRNPGLIIAEVHGGVPVMAHSGKLKTVTAEQIGVRRLQIKDGVAVRVMMAERGLCN